MSYDPPYSPGQQPNADSLPVTLSIEQQAILASIQSSMADLKTYTDGLEGLATSLNSYTDGLETLVGNTNSLITTLNGYVDGLEALIGTTNSTLSTLNAKFVTGTDIGDVTINNTKNEAVFMNPRSRNPAYRLFVPAGAAGANKVYFDLFNASGSGKTMRIIHVIPVVSGAVAVTGAVAVDLFLTKTSAVGTGGTAATSEGTALTAATITRMDSNNTALPAQVTARLAPAGGATAGAVVSGCSVFTEETNAGTYLGHMNDLVTRNKLGIQSVVCNEGQGIRVVQGSVASVGNIGFDVIFELE